MSLFKYKIDIKYSKWLAIGIVVIIAAFFIFQFWFKGSKIPAYQVRKQDYVPSLIISGQVIPETSVSISAPTSGTVVQCLVKKGESVQKGQLLVQLDDRQARVNRDASVKAVQLAQLNLQQAATVSMEEAHLTSVQAILELQQAQRDYYRDQTLLQAGAISQQNMDQADTNLKLAIEKDRAAQVALAAFGEAGVNLQILQTELQQRQLDLANQELMLEQSQITAPNDGQIMDLYVSPGQLLQVGSQVALIGSSRVSRVQIKPDQSYAALAAINNRAQVWIPSQADTKWEARVVFAEPVGNADQGTVTVELSLQNNVPELFPGQLVSVQLFGELQSQVVIVPEVYLNVQQSKSGVWLVRSGRAHFTEVQVQLQTPDGALINTGLQNGDVLLQPTGLHEGQRVIPQIMGS